MFYSHEILASPKYGVATVWLVANLGHNTVNRKLTRKAIEGVNVPQACDTIERPPGAPIALRLQGRLLYGVSGVYSEHGRYLLEDTEKMWLRMHTYFRGQGAANLIDPNAGKAKRAQLVLNDDPTFVPDVHLPALEFEANGDLVFPRLAFSQLSGMNSQLSPFTKSSSSGSPANLPYIDLDIRHSSSQLSANLASPFDRPIEQQNDNSIMAFGDEEALPWHDFPIRIDADGNLIEEPELPAHPAPVDEDPFAALDAPAQKVTSAAKRPDDDALMMFGEEDGQIILHDDEQQQLHRAAMADPAPHSVQNSEAVPLPSEEEGSSDLADVPQPRRRQRKTKTLAPDAAIHVSRAELRTWMTDYTTRIEEAQHAPQQVTAGQAKKNAYNLVFGTGLGGIGVFHAMPGIQHELSDFFAGDNLQDMLMGDLLARVEQGADEHQAERGRGDARRRSASVAFGSEADQGRDVRRVRPRADQDIEEQGQEPARRPQDAQMGDEDDAVIAFGSDPPEINPEQGRKHPGSALSDHHRSSNAPWNRHSSVEMGRNAVEGSPLVGRGSLLQHSNAKYSEDGAPPFGSGGLAPLQYDGAQEFSSFADPAATAGVSAPEANTSQLMREALDREGRSFFDFVERKAVEHGEEDEHDEALRWVEFDGLFDKEDQTRAVVAQAFLHVLALATKGQIKVKQAGLEQYEAFGEIRVGVTAAAQGECRSAEADVLDVGEDHGESPRGA